MLMLTQAASPLADIGMLYLVLVIVVVVICILWLLNNTGTPKRIAFFIVAFSISPVLPYRISLLLQVAGLSVVFIEWLWSGALTRRGKYVVPLVAAVIAYWAALVFHLNVPDLDTGIQGLRKSVLAIGGLVLGCAIQPKHREATEILIIKVLIIGLSTSLVAYFWLPGIEQLVSRQADQYTAQISGTERLQGIYPGPFHAALASLVLTIWSTYRWNLNRKLALVAMIVGVTALYFTYVRTAYVALALAVMVGLVLSRSLPKISRIFALTFIAVVPMTLLVEAGTLKIFDVAASIFNFGEDGRFQNRLPEYKEGMNLFADSPLIGWGAGSAGDTLGDEFLGHSHISPHNVALKMAVEGGTIGVVLWLLLMLAVLTRLNTRTTRGKMAVALLVALLGLGLTTSSIEAVPPAYLLFVLVGLAVSNGAESGPAESRPPRDHSTAGGQMKYRKG